MSSNKTVAEHLRLIAQLSALDGKNRFQIKAFEEAVVTIIALGDQDRPVLIEKLVKEKALRDIPNIGESVASVIEEFLKTGTSARLKDLGTRWPVEAMSMIAVNTVGPKTAMKLYREQGIHNFDELVLAAKEGKLKEKLAQEVLAADRRVQGRVPHDNAKFLAEKLLEEMK